ncbi:MAG: iron-containing alcohol dehydrogenase [Clostridia bacterium]|mgnify:CR=1 FL=1|jgi:alcohol dehydrogenase|nr:iron-containing alcohol dehydrogenase [Clostridia bacterium]MBT7121886.1 iron-containing alcohol dehydrogenase [Clostridia bacterium]
MLDFRFSNTTEIIFGRDTQLQVGEETAKHASKVLICSYGQPFEQNLMNTIKESLDKQNIDHCELSGIKPNPEETKVYEGIEMCRSSDVDFILAVGGGSVIDTAKAIAAGVKYDGDFWDLYLGGEFSEALPMGVVLTFPATGSESSNGSVVTNASTGYKLAIIDNCLRPKFAILNPELTFTLPPYQTFCGVADIMSHVMERYFSSTTNTDLTDRLSEGIIRTAIRNALIVLENPNDYDARAEIMLASTIAHNDLVGVGRTQDWASHMIGMEVSAVYDSTHGATLSVLTPAWAKYVYKDNLSRFVQFAMRIFDVEYDIDEPARTAIEGIKRMEAFFKRIGVPATMQDMGIKTTDRYMEMAEKACQNGPLGDIKKLQAQDVYNILMLATQ